MNIAERRMSSISVRAMGNVISFKSSQAYEKAYDDDDWDSSSSWDSSDSWDSGSTDWGSNW